jgi:hypothetical protein
MTANPRNVPEIRIAVEMLEEYERSALDYNAARKFVDAIRMLNEFLECEPESPHKAFIQRLKVSHTRSMLKNLSEVSRKDQMAWVGHVAMLMTVDAEAKSLSDAAPELKADYDAFIDVWRKELLEGIEALERQERRAKGPT